MVSFFKIIGFIVVMVSTFVGFIALIMLVSINMAHGSMMWSQVPSDMHLKVSAWNTVLVLNVVVPFLASSYLFYYLMSGGPYGRSTRRAVSTAVADSLFSTSREDTDVK